MISICYTMPTRGVSRIHEAITINPEGVARGINGAGINNATCGFVVAECIHDTPQVGMV